MIENRWLRTLSIILSASLVAVSIGGVIVYATDWNHHFYDGFALLWIYMLPGALCTATGRHKAAVVLGGGVIAAAISAFVIGSHFSYLWAYAIWDNRTRLIVGIGVPLTFAVLGAAATLALLSFLENRSRESKPA